MSWSRKQSTWCSRNAACSEGNVVSSSVPRATPLTVAPSAGSRRSIWIVVVVMVAPVSLPSLHRQTEAAVRDDVALDLVRSDADRGVEVLDDVVGEAPAEDGVGIGGSEQRSGHEAAWTEQRHTRRRDALEQLGDEHLAHRRQHRGVVSRLLSLDHSLRERVRQRDVDPEARDAVASAAALGHDDALVAANECDE